MSAPFGTFRVIPANDIIFAIQSRLMPTAKERGRRKAVRERSPVALLLIDVINDLEWQDGELIEPFARDMSRAVAALKARAKALGIPVIYVNDGTTVYFSVAPSSTSASNLAENPVAAVGVATTSRYFCT